MKIAIGIVLKWKGTFASMIPQEEIYSGKIIIFHSSKW
jgi:hypothetical protein